MWAASLGVGVEGVADRLGDVEADEVQQRERAHRVAGAELHAGVDLACLHAGPLDHANGVEEVGEEQAVDDEAGLVGDLDRGLAQRRTPGERLLAGLGGAVGEADLDQLHPRHRVEDVQAEELLGSGRGGDFADPSEEVVVARSARGQASARVPISSAFASTSSTIASTTTSQSARSLGSVVTRRREGSASSIFAQAATTFSSARQAEASLRASRIVSAVVVETAARPVAIAPLPAIPGLAYP